MHSLSMVAGLIFLSLFLQTLPFLVIGSLLGSVVVHLFPVQKLLNKVAEHRTLGVILAAASGLLIPSCECLAVPLLRRFLKRGLPLSTALAFLLASPGVNPICLTSTYFAYQAWDPVMMVVLRGGGSLLLAIGVALVMQQIWPQPELLHEHDHGHSHGGHSHGGHSHGGHSHGGHSHGGHSHGGHSHGGEHDHECCDHDHDGLPAETSSDLKGWARQSVEVVRAGLSDLLTIVPYVAFGCLLAAILQEWFPEWTNGRGMEGGYIPAAIVLAFLICVCSSADAFIGASFGGWPLGAHLAFLWTGPVLDLKLVILYGALFRARFVVMMSVLVVIGVLLLSMGADFLWGGSL